MNFFKKIKILFYFFLFFKFNLFYLKKKFFLSKIINLNNLKKCIDCHISHKFKIGYGSNIIVPKIKNQSSFYIKNSLFSYKYFFRKSIYMNDIALNFSDKKFFLISLFF